MSLDAYTYSAEDVQRAFNERQETKDSVGKSLMLTTCALSGLPLGWLPSKKLAFRGIIPFHALTSRDVLISVECAFRSPAPPSPERIFAFWALLYKLPEEQCEIKSTHMHADWTNQRMRNLLTNHALKNLASFVETMHTLTPRMRQLLPAFRVTSSFYDGATTTSLEDFPTMLVRWVHLIESSKLEEAQLRAERRADRDDAAGKLPVRFFARRSRGERLSPFDKRATPNTAELTDMAARLAQFYERKMTLEWEQFVRNPRSANIKTIKKVMDAVREKNVQEDVSDDLVLSGQFLLWLEENYMRSHEEQQAARRVMRVIAGADANNMFAEGFSNVQDLLARGKELDQQTGMPQREGFKDLPAFLDALAKWRKAHPPQEPM